MKRIFFISLLFSAIALVVNAQQITYNFNDNSWGDPITQRLESGSYPTSVVNDVRLNSSYLYQKDGKGTKRVILDKRSTKSSIEFPVFTDKQDVVIEASTGTDGKTLIIEEKIGNKWVAVGEPTVLTKQKASYSFKLSDKATQIRISNPTTSALYIYKVIIK